MTVPISGAVSRAERAPHRRSILPSRRKRKEHSVRGTLQQPVRRDTLGELCWEAQPSVSLAPFPTCSYFEGSS